MSETFPVLYIHPAKQDVDLFDSPDRQAMGRPYGLIPIGVPALVNVLRENDVPVKGIDFALVKKIQPRFDLREWLRQYADARIVLIDLHWYEHSYGAISVARVCKEVLPDTWVVIGGLTASAFAAEILENFPVIDFIIRGDAERPLLTLAQQLLATPKTATPDLTAVPNLTYRAGDAIVENERTYCAASEDLESLNYVDIDFLENSDSYYVHEYLVTDMKVARLAAEGGDVSRYRGRWLCTARGCDFNCSYCGGSRVAHKAIAGRNGIVPVSPECIMEQIKRLYYEKDVIQVAFSYDIAEMGKSYWRKLFSLIRKSGIKIGLYNEFFQLPPRGFVKDFARTGVMEHSCLALNPYSGSDRVRRLNGKRYSEEELFLALDELNLYNVQLLVYFSLNLPAEDEAATDETIALANRIYDHYPSALLRILNSCHTVEPLSPMTRNPERYGVKILWHTFMDWYTYCQETQLSGPGARTGEWRGFTLSDPEARSVKVMADKWDAERRDRSSWWPLPPSW